MKTEQITDTITLIRGKNNGKFPFSHSFLVEDDVTALIDTGCGIENLEKLKPKKIDIVINSHSHPDHTAGNWIFPTLPLIVPEEEVAFNSNIKKLSERYAGKELSGVWRDFVSTTMNFQNARPTHTFHDKDILHFGTTALEAIHTPGHTVGHYCFFERSERILFSFDIDFSTFGPWYGHEESDIEQFKNSIEQVRALEPAMVVSSHRGIITEAIEEEFDIFVQIFQKRDDLILEMLDEEKSLEEIVNDAVIYRDFSFHPLLLKYWEKMMIEKHMERLVRKGMIMKTRKGFTKL
jgi:glyoxylase-like metal-dependent hydrolase (beta-lactamase superfamily II)